MRSWCSFCMWDCFFITLRQYINHFFFFKGSFYKRFTSSVEEGLDDSNYLKSLHELNTKKAAWKHLWDVGSPFNTTEDATPKVFSIVLWNPALKMMCCWMLTNLFFPQAGCSGVRPIHQQDCTDCSSTWARVAKTLQSTGSPETWIHNGEQCSAIDNSETLCSMRFY